MLKSSSEMSAKRATAPASRMALSVAAKVNGLVMTSSPGLRSSTCSDATSEVVPLFTAIACDTPVSSANELLETSDERALSDSPRPEHLQDEVLFLASELHNRDGYHETYSNLTSEGEPHNHTGDAATARPSSSPFRTPERGSSSLPLEARETGRCWRFATSFSWWFWGSRRTT